MPGAATTLRARVCVCLIRFPDCHAVDHRERSIQPFARILLQNTVYDSFESRQVRRQRERKRKNCPNEWRNRPTPSTSNRRILAFRPHMPSSPRTTKNPSCLPINSKQRKIRVVIFMQLINFQSICDLVAFCGQRLRPGGWRSTGYTFLPPTMACVWLANYYLLLINDENAFHSIPSQASMNKFAIDDDSMCACGGAVSSEYRRYFVGVQTRKICERCAMVKSKQ